MYPSLRSKSPSLRGDEAICVTRSRVMELWRPFRLSPSLRSKSPSLRGDEANCVTRSKVMELWRPFRLSPSLRSKSPSLRGDEANCVTRSRVMELWRPFRLFNYADKAVHSLLRVLARTPPGGSLLRNAPVIAKQVTVIARRRSKLCYAK